jgi:D-glycero-D-manno-heptose 1,7-bisphosphate phosphatase
MARAAIFLDRDGTINVEKNYLHKIADWEWIPGSIEAIRAFNAAGYLVVVISNQAGVARGLYTEQDIDRLHDHVNIELAKHGAKIDRYYHCPHHPDFGKYRHCSCRKPLPGLIFKAQRALGIDLGKSWVIGDRLSDIEAGAAAGVQGILVATGYGEKESARLETNVPYVENILAASELIFSSTAIRKSDAN